MSRRYTPPSQCTLCIPTEAHGNESMTVWTLELAHQATCPNAPSKRRVNKARRNELMNSGRERVSHG